MQFEWNQCDGLALVRDQINQTTVATFFNTREKVVTENNILTDLETFSTLVKAEYTYVTNQIV